MPGWISDFLGRFNAGVNLLMKWFSHPPDAWMNWVDASIHQIIRNMWQIYILLTNDIANFSYYVGSFSKASRERDEWIAFVRIPHAVKIAELYAFLQAHAVRVYDAKQRAILKKQLTDLIVRTALILAAAIQKEVHDRKVAIGNLRSYLTAYINQIAFALALKIQQETQERKAAITAVRLYIAQQVTLLMQAINAIIPAVNKAASAGYNSHRADQGAAFTRILDDIATDNPIVKDLVSDLSGIVLDLVEVDDPLIRLAGGAILSQIIDRLGVDKLAGGLADDLISEFLGGGKPNTLQDVTASVASRLLGLEAQWQQFYANGGDDLENLGTQMRTSAGLVFTATMGGFLAAAVEDPAGAASATDAVIGPAAKAIIGPIFDALGSIS